MTPMLEDSTTHHLHITQMISDNAESVAAVYKVLNMLGCFYAGKQILHFKSKLQLSPAI